MQIEEAVCQLIDGEALLFAGAACSIGALNLRNKPFLQGRDLAKHFANMSGITHTASLQDASEAFLEQQGPAKLVSELTQEFTAKRITAQHVALGNMPWKRIYTTNYDNVLEEAFKANSKPVVTVTARNDPSRMTFNQTLCIHLNGYIGRVDKDSVGQELKLVESSYLTAELAASPWSTVFRQDIRFARAVFFIGYSLYDIDIKRILTDSPSLKDKSFFVLGKSPDQPTLLRATRYGSVEKITLAEFCHLFDNVRKTYVPKAKPVSTLSIKEHTADQTGSKITDRAFSDLLLFGKRDSRMILESYRSKERYVLERSAADHLFSYIENGNSVVVVASDLGNGKSLFLEGVRLRALEKGFRVFEVREHNEEAANELDQIAGLGEKAFVTIEEYQDWITEIAQFNIKAEPGSVLVLTARTAIHDVIYDPLVKQLNVESVPELQLDSLDDKEIQWFVDALGVCLTNP